MEKNKTGKYLKYALGEIVLVVIGILIALQLNNLNERNKLKAKEIEILNDFKSSLKNDLFGLNISIKREEQTKSSMKLILAHLESDLPYSDSLKYHFGMTMSTWTSNVNRSVYESLKSEGLDLITNKGLRQHITNLYDIIIIGQKERNDRYRDIIDNEGATILSSRFDQMWNGNYESWFKENDWAERANYSTDSLILEMTPLNYEALKHDQAYHFFLKSLKNRHFWYFEVENKTVKKAVISLLKKIEEELEKLN
ncbi:DUF6090 family protein [Seonamhaeicola maritimus]|uniref:Uncharacterized protein n=1 Tax=Seonamhaeicola maritimus TaxID=2591822 RepID=A0A5C7GDK4_9FLAO|nr:DUF6090 family protein [Seonamhaeicola maritimus]TXG34528.1 hypothetical protein FUA22_18090 [Seonamhaeicola maritimus]